MFTCFVPTYHAKSIYEVDPSFYKAIGVKNLLIDLDNTLDSFRLFVPSERAVNLVKRLQEAGLHLYILSNNHGPRVSSYATKIQLPFLNSARKPFAFKVKKVLKDQKLLSSETMLVGDQLMTDVLCAKKAKIRVLLTEKIVKEDQWTTVVNRWFDRPIRRHLKKKVLLKEWVNVHE